MNTQKAIKSQVDMGKTTLDIVGSDIDETTEFEIDLLAVYSYSRRFPRLAVVSNMLNGLLHIAQAARINSKSVNR